MDSRPALRRRRATLRFVTAALSAAALPSSAPTLRSLSPAFTLPADLDLALRPQLVCALGDDLLAGLNTAGQDGRRPLAQRDLHLPHLDALVGVDDVDIRPRAMLNS